MGFQTLGLNSRYTTVIETDDTQQASFQQSQARTYDLAINTSSSFSPNPARCIKFTGVAYQTPDGGSDSPLVTHTESTETINYSITLSVDSNADWETELFVTDGNGNETSLGTVIEGNTQTFTGTIAGLREIRCGTPNTPDFSTKGTVDLDADVAISTSSSYSVGSVTQE